MTPLVNVNGVLALHIHRRASSIQQELQCSLLVLFHELTKAQVFDRRQEVWEHRVGEVLATTGHVIARGLGAAHAIEVAVHVCLKVAVDELRERTVVPICFVWTFAAVGGILRRA